jgi:hypothetical protein
MVPIWILSSGLTAAEITVYVALRSFADRQGDAYPSVRKVADLAGVAKSTAEKAVARMRELGLLTSSRRHREDGSISGCDYHLVDVMPDALRGGVPRPARAGGTPASEGTHPGQPGSKEHTSEHTSSSKPRPGPAAATPPAAQGTADADPEPATTGRADVETLCTLMADLVEANGSKRPTVTARWRNEARLMLDRDRRDPVKIAELMRWTAQDSFWRVNVLSVPKFRDKYDQLRLKAMAEWERTHPSGQADPSPSDLPGHGERRQFDGLWYRWTSTAERWDLVLDQAL